MLRVFEALPGGGKGLILLLKKYFMLKLAPYILICQRI